MRAVEAWDAGAETAFAGYAADQLMAAAVAAEPDKALLRVWTRPALALSVGRYHRVAEARAGAMQRRLSGGRVVPVGPGVLGVSLALGSADWLEPGGRPLRPDQVLNRALRPILAVLRALGIDAFYGGRDLVTVARRPLLAASFCPFADGAVLVEQFLAVDTSFSELESLAAALDPAGVAGIASNAFASAATVSELCSGTPARDGWLVQLAAAAERAFGAVVRELPGPPHDFADAISADQATYAGFLRERGPCLANVVSVAEMSMLGVVEASAVFEDGHVRTLEISGDVIAPFETLEAVALACEGKRAQSDVLRRIVAWELARPGRFVLGIQGLDELVARLAAA